MVFTRMTEDFPRFLTWWPQKSLISYKKIDQKPTGDIAAQPFGNIGISVRARCIASWLKDISLFQSVLERCKNKSCSSMREVFLKYIKKQ